MYWVSLGSVKSSKSVSLSTFLEKKVPLLQMRKLRLEQAMWLAQGSMAGKGQYWNMIPGYVSGYVWNPAAPIMGPLPGSRSVFPLWFQIP